MLKSKKNTMASERSNKFNVDYIIIYKMVVASWLLPCFWLLWDTVVPSRSPTSFILPPSPTTQRRYPLRNWEGVLDIDVIDPSSTAPRMEAKCVVFLDEGDEIYLKTWRLSCRCWSRVQLVGIIWVGWLVILKHVVKWPVMLRVTFLICLLQSLFKFTRTTVRIYLINLTIWD